MGLFNNFPFTNFHELNLDWVLKGVTDANNEIEKTNTVLQKVSEGVTDANNEIEKTNTVLQKVIDKVNTLDPDNPITSDTNKRILTVGASGCDHTTINSAISAASTYATAAAPVNIIICEGEYDESIYLRGISNINLFGIGAVTVHSNVSYPYAALYLAGRSFISGIMFINDGDGYACHIEYQDSGTETENITFYNCGFTVNSSTRAGLGCGLGINNKVEFFNCYFNNNGTAPGLYLHGYPRNIISNSSAVFKNCKFSSAGTNALSVDDVSRMYGATNSKIKLTFNGCGITGKLTYQIALSPLTSISYFDDGDGVTLTECYNNEYYYLTYPKFSSLVGVTLTAIRGGAGEYYYTIGTMSIPYNTNFFDFALETIHIDGIGTLYAGALGKNLNEVYFRVYSNAELTNDLSSSVICGHGHGELTFIPGPG